MRFNKPGRFALRFLCFWLLCIATIKTAQAATYYVDAVNGDNATAAFDPATSVKPYRTIAQALFRAKFYFDSFGVDTIIVEPGVYTERISISQPGLTLKARYDATATTTQRSILRPSGAGIFNVIVIGASHVNVRGFEIDGTDAYVDTGPTATGIGTKETGITQYGNCTNGISVYKSPKDGQGNTNPPPTHVSVSHCVVHDVGGAGIVTQNDNYNASADLSTGPTGGPDYVSIDDNVIYNTCFWNKFAGSAISFHGNSNSNMGDTGFHCFIRRNRIYGNIAKFSGPDFFGEPKHTDGNGIIVDFGGHQNPPTLIENNLVYKNGGRGIHVFNSSNVTARSNTLYKNNLDPDIAASGGGELTAISAHNILYANNVVVGVGGTVPAFKARVGHAYGQAGGVLKNIVFRANTYWGSGSGSADIPAGILDWNTTFNQNPRFHAPDAGDFRIDAAPTIQYVIDRGSTTPGDFASDDFNGTPRPQGGAIDRGALEVAPPADTTGAIISEFRGRGPNGASDEFVEIFNPSATPLNVSGWSLRYLTASGIETVKIGPVTSIPARGHFLFTGEKYSLSAVSAGDKALLGDALDASGVALYNAEDVPVRQDAIGFAASNPILREGAGLPNVPTAGAQFALVRDYIGSQPKNSADSTGDFLLVATSGVPISGLPAALTPRLGAPSPAGLSSPVYVGHLVTATLLDPSVASADFPNRSIIRAVNPGPVTALILRRTLKNNGLHALTKIRLHATLITSQNSPLHTGGSLAGQADVRLTTSLDEPSVATSSGPVEVFGTRLEFPSPTGQGALGSTLSWDVSLLSPLLPNDSRSFSFGLGVAKRGSYMVALNVEALQSP